MERQLTIREQAYDRNVRYLGYNLLKEIRFNCEPVVPALISEGSDLFGRYHEVENLQGVTLETFLEDKTITAKEKYRVLLHVVDQLQEIDRAGFVIFDRCPRNIQVLSYGSDNISTRQMDLEDFYDKKADALYSLANVSITENILDDQNQMGIDPWYREVRRLGNLSLNLAIYDCDPVARAIMSGLVGVCTRHESDTMLRDLGNAYQKVLYGSNNS